MIKFKIIIVALLVIACSSTAQKKSLKISDFANWNRIENRIISNNGNFVAYEVKKQKGDGILVVYDVQKGQNDTVINGYNAKFSPNSDFLAFGIRIPEDTLRKLKLAKTKKEKMPKESLGILTLSNKNFITYDKVKYFQLSEEQSNWLSFLMEMPKNKKDTSLVKEDKKGEKNKKASTEKTNYQLLVLQPVHNTKFTFAQVDTFAVAKKGSKIAFIVGGKDSTKLKKLLVFDPQKSTTDTLVKDSISFKRLTFDEKGNQIAYLASVDTSATKNFALYYAQLNKPKAIKIVDSLTIGIPSKWSLSENAELVFSKDGTKLFFGTAAISKPTVKDSVLEEDKPKLDVWSYTDRQIQPRQLNQLNAKKKQSYQALYRIKEQQFIQLADTATEKVELFDNDNAEVALGIDNRSYIKQEVWSSRILEDDYLIDLKTGKKKLLVSGKNNFTLSTTGKYAIYFDYLDHQYYTIDIKNSKQNQITKKMAVIFHNERHDTPNDPDLYGIAGWTENDKYVLIYDRYDIWKLDPTGKEAPINLTNGRSNQLRYRYISLDKELDFIPDKNEILLSVFDEKTNVEGYNSIVVSKPESLKSLIKGDFMLGTPIKAKESDKLIWSTQTVKDFPDVKISDLSFLNFKTLSNANPQQAEYYWPTVEIVDWKSFGGDSLRGLLFKPDNFDANRKYPMVVYFYERNSELSNRYLYPQPSHSTISIPFYVSNQYIVFVPDIVYGTGYPGQNAYDAIVSGVQKLINNRNYIDEKHIGLQGQSWGGYQVAYLVTRTNMFAAAMAGAPVSNMTSAYGGIRWESGMSRMFQYEETQSRIGGTLWDKPLNYIENSPLFMAPKVNTPLLIMSNDNDGAVPWYQGIEYFMALYRLQKPVWLLNYNGMNHNIESKYWANRVDLSTRMFGFFNHYLKGEPAPEWMTKGIPAIEKGKKLGY